MKDFLNFFISNREGHENRPSLKLLLCLLSRLKLVAVCFISASTGEPNQTLHGHQRATSVIALATELVTGCSTKAETKGTRAAKSCRKSGRGY